jgi:hypothetical protein
MIFCSSGVLSSWNTLPKTNAVLLFDQIMRGMIESTLPECNLPPSERWTLPLPRAEQHLVVSLLRPGAAVEEPLDVTYVNAERRGVVVNGLLARGVYSVTGRRLAGSAQGSQEPAVWEVPLAVNGEAEESDLTPLARNKFDEQTKGTSLRWVAAGEEIELAGAVVNGQGTWWWVVLVVVVLLVAEMVVVGMPGVAQLGAMGSRSGGQLAAQPGAVSPRLVEQRGVSIS